MKYRFSDIAFLLGKVQPHHLRLALLVLSLALFALGAGAPHAGGGLGE